MATNIIQIQFKYSRANTTCVVESLYTTPPNKRAKVLINSLNAENSNTIDSNSAALVYVNKPSPFYSTGKASELFYNLAKSITDSPFVAVHGIETTTVTTINRQITGGNFVDFSTNGNCFKVEAIYLGSGDIIHLHFYAGANTYTATADPKVSGFFTIIEEDI